MSVREGVHYRGFIIDIMYVYTTVTYKEAVAWGGGVEVRAFIDI